MIRFDIRNSKTLRIPSDIGDVVKRPFCGAAGSGSMVSRSLVTNEIGLSAVFKTTDVVFTANLVAFVKRNGQSETLAHGNPAGARQTFRRLVEGL